MEIAVPAAPKSYSERRAPYVGATTRVLIACVFLLLALAMFWDAVSSHDPDSGSTAGWLMAPVVWLLVSAYQKWKTVPLADRAAVDLKAPRLACRVAIGLMILIAAGGSLTIAIPLQQKQARSKRIRALLAESKELEPANAQNRKALRAVLNRQLETFADFRQQCSDLRGVLDDSDSLATKRTELVSQLTYQFRGEETPVAMLTVLKQLQAEDSKITSALRVMIGCSDTLALSEPTEQAKFRSLCVAPADQVLSSSAPTETALLKELKEKGAKLPPDLLEVMK